MKRIEGQKKPYLSYVTIVIGLATFIDKSRLDVIENGCILCEESLVSSFPILDNESFTLDITERRGVEMNFGARRKKD